MTEGPVSINIALFTGERGIVRAKATIGDLFGLTAFAAGELELNAEAKEESNTAGVGLMIERPTFRGLLATHSAASLHDWGKVLVGCGVLRFGSMLMGIETKVCMVLQRWVPTSTRVTDFAQRIVNPCVLGQLYSPVYTRDKCMAILHMHSLK